MARTTILRYAKYAGTRNAVANKTIIHGFRLHQSNGIGVDATKSSSNLYFVFNNEQKMFDHISHDNRKEALIKLNLMYNTLQKEHNNNPRLIEFEKKHLKTPWLVETVKTYSPILFQEWGIANIGKVKEEIPNDDLALRFNIKNEGYYLKEILDQDKLNQWTNKVINEEVAWQKSQLGNDAGIVGAVVHLDERNIHIHFYSFPLSSKSKIQHTKLFDNKRDLSNRQKSFWQWSKDNIDETIEKYKPKIKTGVNNKDFKQWHKEQRALMNLETLKLQNQNLVNKGIYDNLQQQKEQVLKYLAMDLNHEERMLLQSLLNALDNIQHYHFLLTLAKDNQQKINYQEQITLWQNRTKDLQLTLAPILLNMK
ncbi:MAG: plasmid recombination protein [Spiroplasma sp.]|nr:plasmid recombination protein [Spiroplasma sp.]